MLDTITEIITRAGRIALDYFREVKPAWKANMTYVTEADLAVQAYLHRALGDTFPDDGVIAEENDLRKPPAPGNTRTWLVDPIDGTASFSTGLPVWGVALGLVEDGEPAAGFFYAPAVDDLIVTTDGGQVVRNGQPAAIREPAPLHRESSLFIASRLHRHYTVSRDYHGKLRNLGSSAAHLAYVATGSADCALIERVYAWDVASGYAQLRHNGGELRYLDGSPVHLTDLLDGSQMRQPMLGGHPATVAAFRELIAYHGEGDG
jgi:fructose-1,6-bisphosphatase/inositol monophosphatase family enzyme